MRKYTPFSVAFLAWLLLMAGCTTQPKEQPQEFTGEVTHVQHPSWSRNAVIYEVNIRQYTNEGTIKAFQQHLPRLKELGVDILWFMPIHPISEVNRKGTLGSYYAIRDYQAVNPEFGTIEDFKALVQEAHSLGFKVLLDWVANHSGCDNVWLETNPDWYVRDENGNPVSPYDWTDTYKLDYDNPAMRKGMTDALTFWVSECDIDGYRCDVAYEVPTDFWDQARKELEAIKPVFMLAEADVPELTLNAFDMTYNWPLKNLVNQIAKGKNAVKSTYAPIDAPEEMAEKKAVDLDELLASYEERYPQDSYVMNFITNHDENSWDGSEFTRLGDGVKAFAVLTYTIPGMPLIYT
ncbi:MAG: alpha-amylase, partial [Tannerellaceae bacterium]|nr:alpha-amylase [Tannerellaceae bacterium]